MGNVIEELNKIYNKNEQKKYPFKNTEERMDILESKLEKLESEIIDLEKRVNQLEINFLPMGGAIFD